MAIIFLMKYFQVLTITWLLFGCKAQASEVSKYFKKYQLGLALGWTIDTIKLEWKSNEDNSRELGKCNPLSGESAYQYSCSRQFQNSSRGNGLFLEQPLKRSGFWYFDWDLGFSLKSVQGIFKERESGQAIQEDSETISADFKVVSAWPYVKFGITPDFFPDVLFAFGPSIEMQFGSVTIEDTRYETENFYLRYGMEIFNYTELQLVFYRFGKGYLGYSIEVLTSSNGREVNPYVPETIGEMHETDIEVVRQFSAFKFLTSW